jgi:hypothetical protein
MHTKTNRKKCSNITDVSRVFLLYDIILIDDVESKEKDRLSEKYL